VPPLIVTHPIAAVLFTAACLIWLLPETLGASRQMARAARTTASVRDRGSMTLLIGLQWLGLGLDGLLAWGFPGGAIGWQTGAFILGLVCMLLGVTLRQYAIWTLGHYFTRDVAVSSGQPVVQRGPYHLIRHPAYSGTFLTMLGVGLALGNWAGLFVLLTGVFLGHFYRVRIEEKALVEAIGQPYAEYMRHTRRFIPGLF